MNRNSIIDKTHESIALYINGVLPELLHKSITDLLTSKNKTIIPINSEEELRKNINLINSVYVINERRLNLETVQIINYTFSQNKKCKTFYDIMEIVR